MRTAAPLPSSGIKEEKYRHVDCDGTQEYLKDWPWFMSITHIWAKSIICQPILDLPTGICILVTTFWWKSFPENDLPKMAVAYDSSVSCLKHLLSLSLSFPYTHHDFELMFTAFWDFDVQLTPMLLKTRWTANHTPRFLQQKKAWIWYQPWPKTPFQHDGMISGHEEAKKPIWKKDEKGAHGWTGPWLLLKVPSLFNKPNMYNCSTSIRFSKWQSVTRSNLAIRWGSRFLLKMKVILV